MVWLYENMLMQVEPFWIAKVIKIIFRHVLEGEPRLGFEHLGWSELLLVRVTRGHVSPIFEDITWLPSVLQTESECKWYWINSAAGVR